MKLDTNNPQHAETLARYLSGEMDPHERSEFEAFMEAEPGNLEIVDDMEKLWRSAGTGRRQPDARSAWKSLQQRFTEDQLIPAVQPSVDKRGSRAWLRIAAALLVLIAAGTLITIILMPRKQVTEMVSVTNTDPLKTMIMTLEDGSIVYLAPLASFEYPEAFGKDKREVQLSGEAFFDIQRDPGKPFAILTESAVVEVLGTSFNLKSGNGDQLELKVTTGKVKVTPENTSDQGELVVAGEKLVLNGSSVSKTRMLPVESNRWFTRRMHFRDESLGNIVRVLNRNFNTLFIPGTEKVAERKLTVTFEDETVETMTELICLSLNLKSQVRNDSILLIPGTPVE